MRKTVLASPKEGLDRRGFSKCRQSRSILAAVVLATAAKLASADDLSKPLKASPDGHFLTTPDGEPFFWLADTGWDLFQRPDRDEVERYLSDRAGKGFTVIQTVIGGVHRGPNRYGQLPFVDLDIARPNPAYFENVDWVVERAAHYGIRVAAIPYWGMAIASGRSTDPRFEPAKAEAYGRFLGERYRDKGMIWILGGDSNPLWPKSLKAKLGADGVVEVDRATSDFSIVDHRPIYDGLANGLSTGHGGKPVMTYHPSCCKFPGTPKPLTSLYFNDRAWLTLHMFQSSHYANPAQNGSGPQIGFDFGFVGTRNYEIAATEYAAQPARPVIDGEARFEDLGIDNDAPRLALNGFWTGYDARNAGYHSVFAGAAGHTYGNHAIWQFYDPEFNQPDPPARLDLTWQQALHRPAAGQMQFLKKLMLSRPYFSRIPDQSLIIGEQGAGTAHIGATRGSAGDYAMVYLPHGQQITIDMSKLSGKRFRGWWYDPRTGVATRIEHNIPGNGTPTFTPPSSGKENDWVLVIDDAGKNFGPPGMKSDEKQ